jgi:branched-chain amino acid aminotransferase
MILDYPAYQNGVFCKVRDLQVSILDLGFIHSDATYDVLAVKDGKFVNLQAHLDRFVKSCSGWRIPLKYSKEEIKGILNVLLLKMQSHTTDCLVWIAVTRGVPTSGNPRDMMSCEPNFYAYIKPYFGFNASNSATVCLAKQRRNDSVDQTMKNFAWNDLNLAQWEAIDRGYDTAILLNRHDYITEGPGFNVGFISKDNFVYAPRSNCLRGTTMQLVEKLCEENNKQFFYADISDYTVRHDIAAMFLTSTAGNVIRVTKYENIEFEDNEMLSWLMKSI